jgi:DNA polymerase-3 subunit alpha
MLTEHREGLIVLSGGLSGEIDQRILTNDVDGATARAVALQELLGEDNFFLEVMETGYEPQRRVRQDLLGISAATGIPVVATNDVHYRYQEDWIVQDILMCIRDGRTVSDQDRFKMGSRELHFKTRAEMAQSLPDAPQGLANTVAIAERCNVVLDFETYHLPVFDCGSDKKPEELFVDACHEGARTRYGTIDDTIQTRLDYEIGVILKLGFASYFLITADFINYARNAGIPVGPGRGSAAGSIVAYSLGITDLDPLKYNLIFERFLNAERISMPDIDVDFCGDRRDEVIDYVRSKYGKESVSQIITFGTMASRGVLRDVGRVLEVPLDEVDAIAKKVQQGPGASLAAALEQDKDLQKIRDASPSNRRLFDLGLKLEGLMRHSSIHAAGVVVSDRPLSDYVPMARSGDDMMTQWQMTELEQVGLLKVDFLGLKTLTILREGADLVKKVRGIDLDLDNLPLDDRETYELMTQGNTLGVFQLESSGMRELLAKLRPDTFEDVIAVLALFRPGPLGSGMVDMFVRRKHGQEFTEYPHESTQPILEETHGIIVYQEQVMRIANLVAGFTMNEADKLRSAMSKKKPEVMAKFKDQFVKGTVANGHDVAFGTKLFETIEYFAGYGFNKSHSAAYALLTHRTAFLKAHYPLEFYAANLTVESGNTDKVKEFVEELTQSNIGVHPPDINASLDAFGVVDGTVTYGFRAIKGVGQKLAQAIAAERQQSGDYASLEDFCERLDPLLLNKSALEALAKAGAFDCFGITRKTAFDSIEAVIRSSAQIREDRRRGQGMLFAPDAGAAAAASSGEEWSDAERLAHEKEAIGLYLSGHPIQKQGRFLAQVAGTNSKSLQTMTGNKTLRMAGMINNLKVRQVRKGRNIGQRMAKFQLEDLWGVVQVTCFAHVYQKVQDALHDDDIVVVTGRLDKRDDEPAIIMEEIQAATDVVQQEVDGIVVHLSDDQVNDEVLGSIESAAAESRGEQRLMIEVQQGKDRFLIRPDSRYGVRVGPELFDSLAPIAGWDHVSFTRRVI